MQRDLPGGVGVGYSGVDEPKPECLPAAVGGLGALAGLGGGNDNVTRIVNKRFMRQTAGEEMVSIMGGGKETTSNTAAAGSGTEVRNLEMHSYLNSLYTITIASHRFIN